MAKNNVNLTGKSNLLTGNMELHGNIDLQAVEGVTPAKGNGVVKGSAAEDQNKDDDIKSAFESLRKEFGDVFDNAFGPLFSSFKESMGKLVPETPFDETINSILGGKKGTKNDENINNKNKSKLKNIDPKVAPGFILVYNKLDDIYEAIVNKKGDNDKGGKGGSLLGFVKGLAGFAGAVLAISAAILLFAAALFILKISGGTVGELVGMSIAMTAMVLGLAVAGRIAKNRTKEILAIGFAIALIGGCVLMVAWAVKLMNDVGFEQSIKILVAFFAFIGGLMFVITKVANNTKKGLKDLGQVGLFLLGVGGCVLILTFAIKNIQDAIEDDHFVGAMWALVVLIAAVGLVAMGIMAVGPSVTGSLPAFVGLGIFMVLLGVCIWLLATKVIGPMEDLLFGEGWAGAGKLLITVLAIGVLILALVGVAYVIAAAGAAVTAALPGLIVMIVAIGIVVLVTIALVMVLENFDKIGEAINKAWDSLLKNGNTFEHLGLIFLAFLGSMAAVTVTLVALGALGKVVTPFLKSLLIFLGVLAKDLLLILTVSGLIGIVSTELEGLQIDTKIKTVFETIGKVIKNIINELKEGMNTREALKLIPKLSIIAGIFKSIDSILQTITKAAKMAAAGTEENQNVMKMAMDNIIDVMNRIFTKIIPALSNSIESLGKTRAFKKGIKTITKALDPIEKIFKIVPELIEKINKKPIEKKSEELEDKIKDYFKNLTDNLRVLFNGEAIGQLKNIKVSQELQGTLDGIKYVLEYFDPNNKTSIINSISTTIESFGKINTTDNAKAKSDEVASFFENGIQPMFDAINAIQGFENAARVVKYSEKLLNVFNKYQGLTIDETIPKAIENISAALAKLSSVGDIKNQVDSIKTFFQTISVYTNKFKKNFKDFDIAEILKVDKFNQVTNAVSALANALERLGNTSVLSSLDQISTKIDEAANKLSQVGGMLNNTKFVGANSQQSEMLRPQMATTESNIGSIVSTTDDKNSQDEMLKLMQKWDKDGLITKSKKEAEKEQAGKSGKSSLRDLLPW